MKNYYNSSAINHLSKLTQLDDLNTSSHWSDMHKFFKYQEGILSGTKGFGDYISDKNIIRKFANFLLQRKLVKRGTNFVNFEKILSHAKQICRIQGRLLDQDMLRQVITLSYLFDSLENFPFKNEENIILVIGDGWGSLSTLLLKATKAKIVIINLKKTLLVDLIHINKACPDINFCFSTSKESFTRALNNKELRLISLKADDYKFLCLAPINLAINIASMQEMNYQTIHRYFDVLRSIKNEVIFYYCNRKEKIMPDGSLIKFERYGWLPSDVIYDHSECPWHQEYFTLKPPFYFKFDGIHLHKLVRLTKVK